ncbi:hypothetical protein ES332_D09G222100v1 [Gossypium tomentosum]|uniref:Uncharacterized protein n=1 Tax=Gossypium tomentosum TaxID=34277 RepID=A0A5D2JL92_GOSTO|nr:hypothetical protein ES332_D09G222100v1 [Gossypium tomentosum]
MELETRTKRQPRDGVERTSDNQRKASAIGEAELEIECVASKDNVVVIQFRCPWRDGLDALSNSQFGMPFSSIIHLSLIIKSKIIVYCSIKDQGSVRRVV